MRRVLAVYYYGLEAGEIVKKSRLMANGLVAPVVQRSNGKLAIRFMDEKINL